MITSDPGDTQVEHREKRGPLAFLPERTCAICYADQNPGSTSEAEVLGANAAAGGGVVGSVQTDIANPYETIPCQCVYCFVCLAGKIEAEEGSGWSCLRCGETVFKCRPWRGDVLVESAKSRDGKIKTVGFVETSGHDDGNEHVDDVDDEDQDEQGDGSEQPSQSVELESELGSSQWQFEGNNSENN